MKHRSVVIAQWILIGVLLTSYLNGCSILQRRSTTVSRDHVFIDRWPVPPDSSQMRLAVKDNIDMKGVVTSAGSEYVARTNPPASVDAPCLAIARKRNVWIVGKTNLSEFAVAPSGLNDYYGTPRNPFNKRRKLIPGGSSSGSAVAIANGSADVAFGTDTAGSIRVPAACCGIVGLKTTFGLISTKGVFPIEPKHLDTVGPMGKDVAHVVQGMDLLQEGFSAKYQNAVAAKPSGRKIRIGRLYLSGTDRDIDQAIDETLARANFQVIKLNRSFEAKWNRAKGDGNTLAAAGAWISNRRFRFRAGVGARTMAAIVLGRVLYPTAYRQALNRRVQWQYTLRKVFKKVDFIALPTLQTTPPAIPVVGRIALLEARMLNIQNTVPVNVAGNPALTIPVPLRDEAVPVTSLQLVGPKMSEAALLNAGRLIEAEHSEFSRQVRAPKTGETP